MSDKLDLIKDSIERLHDKFDKIDERTRSLEETRAHQKGAVTMAGLIATAISGFVSLVVSTFKH